MILFMIILGSGVILMDESGLQKLLQEKCSQIIVDKDWTPFSDFEAKVIPTDSVLEAYINLSSRQIHIHSSKDIFENINECIKDEKLELAEDELFDKIIYTILVHEYSHHRDCPRSPEGAKEVLEGCYAAVEAREWKKSRIDALAGGIDNMFSDTIINTINSHEDEKANEYSEGINLVYLLFGRKNKTKDKAHILFLDAMFKLCYTPRELQRKTDNHMKWFFWNRPRIAKKLVDVFTGNEYLTNDILNRKISEDSMTEVLGRIKDYSLWQKMAYEYARIIVPYMKEPDMPRGIQDHANPRGKQHEKDGAPSSEKNSPGQESGQGDSETGENNPDGSGAGKADKSKKKDKGKGKKDSSSNPLDDFAKQILAGQNPNIWLGRTPELHEFYKAEAGLIPIICEEGNRVREGFEKYIGSEELTSGFPDLKKIDWAATRFELSEGKQKVILYEGEQSITLPIEAMAAPGALVDLSFILDCSGSMDFNPHLKQGSYHLAALAVHSVLRPLELAGIAPLLNYHMISYSDMTKSSAWQPHGNLLSFMRTMFDYQGGMTYLDPDALLEMADTRLDNVLSFMLTDGAFNSPENSRDVLDAVDNIINRGGIDLHLFHIGYPNSFYHAMQELGVKCRHGTNPEDFLNHAVTYSRSRYGGKQ